MSKKNSESTSTKPRGGRKPATKYSISLAAHLSRLQSEYSAARQRAETEALEKIHAAVNGGAEEDDGEPSIEGVPA